MMNQRKMVQPKMAGRREFVGTLAASAAALSLPHQKTAFPFDGVQIKSIQPSDDLFSYITEVKGKFDADLYRKIIGAANEFKEGDQIIGVSAENEQSRRNARRLLANTKLGDIDSHTIYDDKLARLLKQQNKKPNDDWTLGQLKKFLLSQDETKIKSLTSTLTSDVIACVVKLMSNDELVTVSSKVFNPLPNSKIGAKGYLGARIQPNSPTDNVDDIRWQVFNAWAFAVGDVLLGTNPVSSDPQSVAKVEATLKDLLTTFDMTDTLPHCVLSHIDVQAEVEKEEPGTTALWFQSIAGTDSANQTFDISIEKMMNYAAARTGQFGMYFETGQGADFTNGHGHGFDMVVHESRKYGFAREMTKAVASAQRSAGSRFKPWVHLNDVAGFIGPEVFRTREQLVRCCLEDLVMGKLHGLCIGLDVCSTLHMDVSLQDLDWCLDQIMPANPAYLMALPTKIDPMLGYLTTGYQDHLRLRNKFGYKVNDQMWAFFQRLQVIDSSGNPTEHFGDPVWIYLQYRKTKDDRRPQEEIIAEGKKQIFEVRARGVFLSTGHGDKVWDLEPSLAKDVRRIYDDAKESIWAELEPKFISSLPDSIELETQSEDRPDYLLHPASGEQLTQESNNRLDVLRKKHRGEYDVQIVISDGLNALSIMDKGHMQPFLKQLRQNLEKEKFATAPEHLVLTSGRVRAGYRMGERLFGDQKGKRAVLHIIGERPGTGHHTFSIYITAPDGSVWGEEGKTDHNITKVVSGVALTALPPAKAADETVRILKTMV